MIKALSIYPSLEHSSRLAIPHWMTQRDWPVMPRGPCVYQGAESFCWFVCVIPQCEAACASEVMNGSFASSGRPEQETDFTSGNKVSLRTTPLENTSIRIGPARKNSCRGRMARRAKRNRKRENQDRKRSLFKKLSKQSAVLQTSKSFSSGLHQSLSSSESLPASPTHSLSPGPTTPSRSPAPDLPVAYIVSKSTDTVSPQSTSPCSSTPSSPAGNMRPSSLQCLAPKLSGQRYKVGRRKSTSSIPPSPLACTPCSAPQAPLSPQRSPSPLLPVQSRSSHGVFQGSTLSPPTIARQGGRNRTAEPPRSPLLKRVQSVEKMATHFASGRKLTPLDAQQCEDLSGAAESLSDAGSHYKEWGSEKYERDQEVVVMRRLNLSERRDSFKKQEAVQEVSFDEQESVDANSVSKVKRTGDNLVLWEQIPHKMTWVQARPSSVSSVTTGEEQQSRLVPQIAVQISDNDEQEKSSEQWECQGFYPLHPRGKDKCPLVSWLSDTPAPRLESRAECPDVSKPQEFYTQLCIATSDAPPTVTKGDTGEKVNK